MFQRLVLLATAEAPLSMAVASLSMAVASLSMAPARAAEPAQPQLAADMSEAARRFLSALPPAQRQRVLFTVGDAERLDWHYIPRPRRGVALGELGDAARDLAHAFLATALSRRGLLEASAIMALEEVLRRREHGQGAFVRDAGAYFVSVFGAPSTTATWGWRLEGHHLSLNVTVVGGTSIVVAPAFFGASPATLDDDVLAGLRPLGRAEELGFRLVVELDAAQRAVAILAAPAPEDILAAPDARLTELPGLAVARMTPAQRALVAAIVDATLGNLPRELAERERARIAAHGVTRIVFTWAGATAPGQPHYYRLSGPTFLFELDNTQDNATHVHTVWHARAQAGGDFGVDLLREHYRQQ